MALDGKESSGFDITSRFSSVEPQDDCAPLWAFATISDKIAYGGAFLLYVCLCVNFC